MSIQELFSLQGKTALVTGGGRGIGKTITAAYCEASARVMICGRREEYLAPTVAELTQRGFDVRSLVADLSKPEDVQRTVSAALDAFGQLDLLVNNAGQTWGQPTEEYPLAKWQQILDVNLTAMFLLSQAIGKHMIARGQGGRILNIASVAGIRSGQGANTIAYNTSKAGVIAFTRTLARDWGRHGILVNAIAPGWFPTRMAAATIHAHEQEIIQATALGRLGKLDDLKGAAIFFASPASSYITGQTLVIDGGSSL
ncbi:MAG TPA: glucose 1-dehydrogenase [Ktedonobacterales bacterium]